jgi:hypothetical protein
LNTVIGRMNPAKSCFSSWENLLQFFHDLAGCRLVFENPDPLPFATPPPARSQRGEAGDITAARKVRVYDIPFEDA